MTHSPVHTHEITLHGHKVFYRAGGDGPLLVLIHGITSSSATWEPVLPLLAEHFTILAPDLLGHGDSAKPVGDYSLGGGVAMQVGYQFPELMDRLVLVSSGGLGREVSLFLRAATLPGAELVLPLLASGPVLRAGETVGRALGAVGLRTGSDLGEIARGIASLNDVGARSAFVHTARSVIDVRGQRVDARDRLYLAQAVPSLLIWGERDPIIPAVHGARAHELMPGSRLELFEGAGHFPHLDEPVRFAGLLRAFTRDTEPAHVSLDDARELILAHAA